MKEVISLEQSELNAWPQGAAIPDFPDDPDYHTARIDCGWILSEEQREKYPLLALALRETIPAYSVRVEWLDSSHEYGFNFMQILRLQHRLKEGDSIAEVRRSLYERLLADTELVLEHGHRSLDYEAVLPLSTCGGALELLGRLPEEGDTFMLRPLSGRGPFFRLFDWDNGGQLLELLTEFSLQAHS